MAEIFGIDFGTTNSLVTYIGADGRPHSALDTERRPHPSVIWFHGDRVIVGREARQHLDAGRDAVAGDFIRSPKRLLYRGEGDHAIPGRVIDHRDAVSYVLEFLRGDLAEHDPHAPPFEHGVFTIPITFDGNARRDFREAARRAGLNVVYFVHEPLAALYAYLRDRPDSARLMAELDGKFVLVFDWGGGTLDLTLCQVRGSGLYQIINDGNDEVGGDRFDESLRNLVREKHARQHRLEDMRSLEHQTAGLRLIHRCERAKIALSTEDSADVFVGNFLAAEGPAANVNLTVSRDELQRATENLIVRGLDAIHRLLEKAGIDRTAVELCVPTGGMVNMPAIRNGLGQIFPGRVARLDNGDRIISEGAAWIAADGARPILAKPIEVLDAAQSPFSIVAAGLEMPSAGGVQPFASRSLYCADPRDGLAALTFQRPKRVGHATDTAPRTTYGRMYLKVDPNARPLVEGLHLTGEIDEDYVARFHGYSTGREDRQLLEITDLEFALRVPTSAATETDQAETASDAIGERERRNRHGPMVRSNITVFPSDLHLVAGDIIQEYFPSYLDNRLKNPRNQRQFDEDDYYSLCSVQLGGAKCGKRAFEISYHGCELCGVIPTVPTEIADAKLQDAINEELRKAGSEE